ncbi:MAG: thiamine ABC transporter substrate-binding protein [Treponema sp.]|nr:thiamine ABC transporter substrate-binding protein [Treponema sp.]
MKRLSLFKINSLFVSLAVLAVSCARQSSDKVIVYTYDSFAGDWGPAAQIAERFNGSTKYTVEFVDCGDAVEALNRAILERKSPVADIVLGVDNSLWKRARDTDLFMQYTPRDAGEIIDDGLEEELGGDWTFTPYDWSHFAFIYDTQSAVREPESLSDLTSGEYRKRIIVMDPRTSTPGLGLLSWTLAAYGDDYMDFWRGLKDNILTMTPGWSAGWGMFLEGEAPLVISYTTSPAVSVEYDNDYRYKALVFPEGHVMQVEGAGILKSSKNKDGAKAFMDFLISEAAQETLPLTQWMYPVNRNVELPQSYREAAPVPQRTLSVPAEKTFAAMEEVTGFLSK